MKDQIRKREGFSLIEMIIAIAIVAIVMSSVILLISYSTNSMRRTTNTVNLQNEVKDALLHMTTYVQEGSEAYWDVNDSEGYKALIVVQKHKNMEGNTDKLQLSHYWFKEDSPTDARGKLYYAKSTVNYANLSTYMDTTGDTAGNLHVDQIKVENKDLIASADSKAMMFVKDVVGFECTIRDNIVIPSAVPDSEAPTPTPATIGGKYVTINLSMRNSNGDAEFSSSKDVYLRNA